MLKHTVLKFFAIAAVAGAALVIITPAAGAQEAVPQGYKGKRVWGPPICVHVRSYRSRQTRYAGAARCRRVPA